MGGRHITILCTFLISMTINTKATQDHLQQIRYQEYLRNPNGLYEYGYLTDTNGQSQSRDSDGTIRGYYSYVDDQGVTQFVQYSAGNDGFRVRGSTIPVHKHKILTETPEVEAARKAHEKVYLETRNRDLEALKMKRLFNSFNLQNQKSEVFDTHSNNFNYFNIAPSDASVVKAVNRPLSLSASMFNTFGKLETVPQTGSFKSSRENSILLLKQLLETMQMTATGQIPLQSVRYEDIDVSVKSTANRPIKTTKTPTQHNPTYFGNTKKLDGSIFTLPGEYHTLSGHQRARGVDTIAKFNDFTQTLHYITDSLHINTKFVPNTSLISKDESKNHKFSPSATPKPTNKLTYNFEEFNQPQQMFQYISSEFSIKPTNDQKQQKYLLQDLSTSRNLDYFSSIPSNASTELTYTEGYHEEDIKAKQHFQYISTNPKTNIVLKETNQKVEDSYLDDIIVDQIVPISTERMLTSHEVDLINYKKAIADAKNASKNFSSFNLYEKF